MIFHYCHAICLKIIIIHQYVGRHIDFFFVLPFLKSPWISSLKSPWELALFESKTETVLSSIKRTLHEEDMFKMIRYVFHTRGEKVNFFFVAHLLPNLSNPPSRLSINRTWHWNVCFIGMSVSGTAVMLGLSKSILLQCHSWV